MYPFDIEAVKHVAILSPTGEILDYNGWHDYITNGHLAAITLVTWATMHDGRMFKRNTFPKKEWVEILEPDVEEGVLTLMRLTCQIDH